MAREYTQFLRLVLDDTLTATARRNLELIDALAGAIGYSPNGVTITRSLVEAGTPDHVVINAADGALSSEAQLAITRGGTSASTASGARTALGLALGTDVQAFSTKLATLDALADGTNGQVLSTDGAGAYAWVTALVDPLSARGDLLYRDASNITSRLAVGAAGRVLKSDGTDPSWGQVVDADISASAAVALSKLAAVTASRVLVSNDDGLISASSVTSDELGQLSGIFSSVVGVSDNQTLANKKLTTGSVSFNDTSDDTKQLKLGLSGMTAGKTATLVFTNSADNNIQFPPGNITLVDLSTSQSLLNKRLTSPLINEAVALTATATRLNYLASVTGTTGTANTNLVFSTSPTLLAPLVDDYLEINEESAPSTPASGKGRLYAADGKLKFLNDDGITVEMGASSGNGEKTYVTNPSGTSDAAAAVPAGWSSVGDLDIIVTKTAADLPREYTTASGFKITADSNMQSAADYVYYDFTLDDVDLSKKLKIQWSQKTTGTYAAGDLEVVVTTQADRTTALHTPLTSAIPAADGVFTTTFDASTTAALSLVIRATTDMTTNGGIIISDVVVGPGIQPQGMSSRSPAMAGFIQPFAGSTAPDGWTLCDGSTYSQTTYTDLYAAIGATWATCAKQDGTGGNYSSPSAGTFRVPDLRGVFLRGAGTSSDSAGNNDITVTLAAFQNDEFEAHVHGVPYSAATGTGVLVARGTNTQQTIGDSNSAGGATETRPRNVGITYIIKLWNDTSGNLAQNSIEYAFNTDTSSSDNTTSFGYGSAGGLIPTITASASTSSVAKRCRFPTPFQAGEYPLLLVQIAGAGPFLPVGQTFYYPNETLQNTGSAVRHYGVSVDRVSGSSTDVDVFFSKAGRTPNGTTYGAVGSDYPSNAADRYVVIKAKAGQAVGFGYATTTSSGLVSTTTQSFAGAKTFQPSAAADSAVSIATTGGTANMGLRSDTAGNNGVIHGRTSLYLIADSDNSSSVAANNAIVFGTDADDPASGNFVEYGRIANGSWTLGLLGTVASHTIYTSANGSGLNGVVVQTASALTTNGDENFIGVRGSATSGSDLAIGTYKHSGNSSATGYIQMKCNDLAINFLWVDDSNLLRISTAKDNIGAAAGTVVGSQTSDARLKDNIRETRYGLAAVMALKPVDFEMDGVAKVGFTAQDTIEVVPEAVYDTREPMGDGEPSKLAMEYVTMIPILVKALQELKAEFDAYKAAHPE